MERLVSGMRGALRYLEIEMPLALDQMKNLMQKIDGLNQSEKQIQQQACDYLALDGWRRIRTDMPQLRGLGVQERGMADDLFIRYQFPLHRDWADIAPLRAPCDLLWAEWKTPKGKTAQHQKDWHAAERVRGALTLIAGIDFQPASIEGFQKWYRASGLMRKNLR